MNKQIICQANDLIPNSGVCALVDDEQVAIFYVPDAPEKVFAISNWDPIGEANVLSRGIIGHLDDELVVASPLYKQHFNLKDGKCLEEDVTLKTYSVSLSDGVVYLN